MLVSPFERFGTSGIPWASVYGNHDSNTRSSPARLFEYETAHENCLTRSMISGQKEGVTNYWLPVHSSTSHIEDGAGNGQGKGDGSGGETEDDIPSLLLWFMDSRGGYWSEEENPEFSGDSRPDWVDESVCIPSYDSYHRRLLLFLLFFLVLRYSMKEVLATCLILIQKQVVKWFLDTNADLTQQYGQSIPSLVFFHIPTYATRVHQDHGVNPETNPGINDDAPTSQQGIFGGPLDEDSKGYRYDGQDSVLMQALANTTGIIGTFSGHDHGNDWYVLTILIILPLGGTTWVKLIMIHD
jgi:hypothetical protein